MTDGKRFFHVDDDGAAYYVVANDLDHAKQILGEVGVELCDKDGDSYPIGSPEIADIEWQEISEQDAARRSVWLGVDGAGPRTVLSACEVGDWFTSEI